MLHAIAGILPDYDRHGYANCDLPVPRPSPSLFSCAIMFCIVTFLAVPCFQMGAGESVQWTKLDKNRQREFRIA